MSRARLELEMQKRRERIEMWRAEKRKRPEDCKEPVAEVKTETRAEGKEVESGG